MMEKKIIEKWIEMNKMDGWYLLEFPVWHPHAKNFVKSIDLLFIPQYNKRKIGKLSRKQIESMFKFEFQNRSVAAKLYEAKEELCPEAIGQVLVYSYFLPKCWPKIKIVERGILYRYEDKMSEEVAKMHGIKTYCLHL
jgi:hypothetical protein